MTAYTIFNSRDSIVAVHVFDGEPNRDFGASDFGHNLDDVRKNGLIVVATQITKPSKVPADLKAASILQNSDAYNGMMLRQIVEKAVKEDRSESDVIHGEIGARVFAVSASKMHAETARAKITGLTYQGEDMGDWEVVAKCKRSPKRVQVEDGIKLTKLNITRTKKKCGERSK